MRPDIEGMLKRNAEVGNYTDPVYEDRDALFDYVAELEAENKTMREMHLECLRREGVCTGAHTYAGISNQVEWEACRFKTECRALAELEAMAVGVCKQTPAEGIAKHKAEGARPYEPKKG